MKSKRLETKEDLIELIKRNNSVQNIRTMTAGSISRTHALTSGLMAKTTDGQLQSRESLTQISNRFKESIKQEKILKGISHNSRWWETYRHLLKTEISHRRQISVPLNSQPQTLVLSPESKRGVQKIGIVDEFKEFEWAKTNYDFSDGKVEETLQQMISNNSVPHPLSNLHVTKSLGNLWSHEGSTEGVWIECNK